MQNLFYFAKQPLSPGVLRMTATVLLAAALGALVGCGGGESSTTAATTSTATPATATATNTAPVGTPAATIQLLASNTQIPSSGGTSLDLTAIVLSTTRQAVGGRTVTFSTGTVTTETAFINNISASGVSDANGLVTAKLNLGTNKTNRTITVTATADAATASNNIDVTGTTITISGSTSLAFNAATTLTVALKDSAGTAISGVPLTLTSQTGNTIAPTPATGIVNSSGQITALVTATRAGNDVITASGAGTAATQALTISADSFTFTTPTTVPDIPLNTPTDVAINWTKAGVPQAGQLVSFSVSRGTVANTPATTSAAGSTPAGATSVKISSPTAGPAIVTASGPGGTPAATANVVFVATTAASATVQAVPGTVQVTTGSPTQANNTATISAIVRDAANNLVKNAGVSFTITIDPSGGRLNSASGVTDVSGSTSVTYVAGGTSSAQNGVTISASVNSIGGVPITPVVGTTVLTVSGQSLQVRLGTDNRIATSGTTYIKTYAAVVSDAAGNPVVGTRVNFTLRPGRYTKGIWKLIGTKWVQVINASADTTTVPVPAATIALLQCNNEDTNFNGILDPGEGTVIWPAGVTPALRPGTVATVNAIGTTDASGIATATITYPKDQSAWAEITLEARTSVTSNDPPTYATFYLPYSAADFNDPTVSPPGLISPFGTSSTCFNTL